MELPGSGWQEHPKKTKPKGFSWSLVLLVFFFGPLIPQEVLSFSGNPDHDDYLYILPGVGTKEGGKEGWRWRGQSRYHYRCISCLEGSDAVVASVFGAWREVRKGDIFLLTNKLDFHSI